MPEPTGAPPPPPAPPPGFDQPYSTPRGPVPSQPEPYYVDSTTTPYIPSVQTAPPPQKGISIAGPGAIVMVVAGILAAVGVYFLVDRFIFDRDPPDPAQVAAAFTPVSGTTYQEPPAEAMSALRSIVSAQPDADELIAHLDARALLVGRQTMGVVMIFSVDPDSMTGSYKEDYLSGFEAGSGSSLSVIEIAGTVTYTGSLPIGKLYTFLDPDGLVFLVVGPNAELLERTVSTLATANS